MESYQQVAEKLKVVYDQKMNFKVDNNQDGQISGQLIGAMSY